MAHPDCDDGWLRYAHELDAALAIADWTKGARLVLREVFAQVFGPAKRKAATLAPTDIARRVGGNKSNVIRAIRELVDGGALIRAEDGTYTFVKDYEVWTRRHKGRTVPRLSPAEVAYARGASRHAQALRYATGGPAVGGVAPRPGTHRRSSGVSPDTPGCQSRHRLGCRSGHPAVSDLTPARCPDRHLEGVSPDTDSGSIPTPETASPPLPPSGDQETGDQETHTPPACADAPAREADRPEPSPPAESHSIEALRAERDALAEPLIRFAEALGNLHDTGRPVAAWAREQVAWSTPRNLWWLWGLLIKKFACNSPRPSEAMLSAIMHRYRSRPDGPGAEFTQAGVMAQRDAMGLLAPGESPPVVPAPDTAGAPAPTWPPRGIAPRRSAAEERSARITARLRARHIPPADLSEDHVHDDAPHLVG